MITAGGSWCRDVLNGIVWKFRTGTACRAGAERWVGESDANARLVGRGRDRAHLVVAMS